MVGYKLSKNDWVTPFFVIFRSVREKLLVTVSFDHPVIHPFDIFLNYEIKSRSQNIDDLNRGLVCSRSKRGGATPRSHSTAVC